MKNLKIACIGTGNMGRALLRGMVQSRAVIPSRVFASDKNKERLAELKKELKIHTTKDNRLAVTKADIVVLAVKPQILHKVLQELHGKVQSHTLFVSIAAGFPTGLIENILGAKTRVVRAMPNIAAMVGEAATAICAGKWAKKSDLKLVTKLFETCGTCTTVDEGLMDAVTGLSGTGPMYVFIIIEALSDAGVKVGLSREQATSLAIQTVQGAARMVKETGKHPIFLKDLVTSPGGTAINALYSMEKTGLRADLMDAVEAATNRSKELGLPMEFMDKD